MPVTARNYEWWTGEKLGYETAADLGIDEFTTHTRPLSDYRAYGKQKARRKAARHKMWQLYYASGCDPEVSRRYNLIFAKWTTARNKFWRAQGYPNLRRAWAARSRNCARRRAEKAELARREYWRKYWERYSS